MSRVFTAENTERTATRREIEMKIWSAGHYFSVLVFSLCSLCLCGEFSFAGTPRLAKLTPPGGQQGTTVEVEFAGRGLDDPKEVLFYGPGITAAGFEAVETETAPNGRPRPADPGTRLKVRFKVAADCRPGPHGLRIRTAGGLSDYQQFFVGPFPTVAETEAPPRERNDQRDTAQTVPVNSTVFGRLNDATDVDLYRVEVKRGQRVSAEIEAARLGVERGIPDMHLTISDADGKTLAAADDSALFVQDPVLSVVADRDGAYFVEVRHSTFNGAGDNYRLHVGTFTRPTAVYPAGGPAGADVAVQVLGDPTGPRHQTVRMPAEPGDFPFVATADGGPAPSPNRLRVSPFPNVLEVEPNDSPAAVAAAAVALPVAFNGIIAKPGDVDCFRFRAKKGEQYQFRALAQALGSPVDPAIWVRPASGKGGVQRAADSRPNQLGLAPANGLMRESHDPVLEWTAPADGEYVLGVENERGDGGSDYVYRVEVDRPANAVYTYIAPEPDNRFQPQDRQSISVAAGNRTTVQVGVFATSRPVTGDLELVGVNLPKGVTIHAPTITPGTARVPVVFEAAPGVAPQAALVDLVVRPVAGGALASGYRQTIPMNAYGNNDYYLHVPVEKLALAVTEPAPFRVEVEEPKSALVQNGEMALNVKIHREQGFDGPVTVQMEWRPTGVNTTTPVTVPAGETTGTYVLGANRNAAAGAHRVTLTAMSGAARRGYRDGASRTYVASKPFTLTIAEPHVEARLPRTSVERGKTATLVCKLNHLQKFEGKAKATLARLPRGVELVEPVKEIAAGDAEVTFTLRATPDALVGNYQGVVLDLTVTANGQPVRQLTGYGILRVDAERGVKKK